MLSKLKNKKLVSIIAAVGFSCLFVVAPVVTINNNVSLNSHHSVASQKSVFNTNKQIDINTISWTTDLGLHSWYESSKELTFWFCGINSDKVDFVKYDTKYFTFDWTSIGYEQLTLKLKANIVADSPYKGEVLLDVTYTSTDPNPFPSGQPTITTNPNSHIAPADISINPNSIKYLDFMSFNTNLGSIDVTDIDSGRDDLLLAQIEDSFKNNNYSTLNYWDEIDLNCYDFHSDWDHCTFKLKAKEDSEHYAGSAKLNINYSFFYQNKDKSLPSLVFTHKTDATFGSSIWVDEDNNPLTGFDKFGRGGSAGVGQSFNLSSISLDVPVLDASSFDLIYGQDTWVSYANAYQNGLVGESDFIFNIDYSYLAICYEKWNDTPPYWDFNAPSGCTNRGGVGTGTIALRFPTHNNYESQSVHINSYACPGNEGGTPTSTSGDDMSLIAADNNFEINGKHTNYTLDDILDIKMNSDLTFSLQLDFSRLSAPSMEDWKCGMSIDYIPKCTSKTIVMQPVHGNDVSAIWSNAYNMNYPGPIHYDINDIAMPV